MKTNLESPCSGCGKTPQTCICKPVAPRLSLSPWKVEHSSARQAYVVKDASGYDVAVMLTDFTTDWANAHLIAAVPQLLEALESVRDLAKAALTGSALSSSMQFVAHLSEIRDVANDAIKSAKGETL